MTDQLTARLGAACGIAYVIALLSLNSVTEPGTAVLAAEVLALLLFVPFLVHVCTVLGETPALARIALVAGTIGVAIKLAGVLPTILAERGEVTGALEVAFTRLGEVSFIVSMPPLGVCLAVVAVAALRTRALPAGLAWAAAATGALLVVNGFDLGAEFGPAFLAFLLWTLVTSVVLLRRAVAPYVPAARGARA